MTEAANTTQANSTAAAAATTTSTKPEPQDKIVTTRHSLKLGKKELKYTVTCGTVVLKEEAEKDGAREATKPRAQLFFIAYTLDGVKDASRRPVTFSFNGGPGSSSVWLHLGLLGPKRVLTDDFGNTPPPPYALTDNEHTLLEHSDLVFIDPIGTGFSRMVEGEKVKEYHDYTRDIQSVGEFIRLYLSRHHRWASPKFIIGESYGTTRAAGLSQHLQERYQLYVNGLMLVSCALDFATLRFDAGNDLPYVLYLPTYTATAWHHQRLPVALQKKPLAQVVKQAEEFAESVYAPALFKGARLTGKERAAVATRLAELTGLQAAFVERCDLRVSIWRFTKELLREQGLTVGRLDSRFTGRDRDDAGEMFEFDPSHINLDGAYGALINHYLRQTLNYSDDLPYEVLARFYMNWGWKDYSGRYPHVGETLRRAMHQNPHMRVYVASGYFDLATPHFATDYTLDHLGARAEMQSNITKRYFDSGHMMYIHKPDLQRLAADLRQFVSA
jgi:carboxypeptidase C (cathepsin A)